MAQFYITAHAVVFISEAPLRLRLTNCYGIFILSFAGGLINEFKSFSSAFYMTGIA